MLKPEEATFFFWQTVHEGRIYQLKLFCDTDYPDKPPTVRFQTRINMTCVNQETGMVLTDFHACQLLSQFINGLVLN